MASESAIAEGANVVTSDQINYHQKMFSHPSYRYSPQFSNTFGQPIVLGTSQTPVTVNIPPEVFNLAQSYIMFSVNIPQNVAGTYVWHAQQALKEISHIQFYSGNMWIVDLDNLQNYLDIVLKKELDEDEWLSYDPLTNMNPGMHVSNSLINVAPALRNSNIAITNIENRPLNPSSVNYNEPAYYAVSANNGGVSYTVQFPLRLIKNTAFAIDKNMYFGQTTYLKVYFGPLSKICYSSTSNHNPSAGVKTAYVPAAGTNASIGPLSGNAVFVAPTVAVNFQLLLAIETNQDLRTLIMNQVATSGLSYLIPYVQAFKNPNNGTSQNISIQLDQGNGRSLMKVYHAPYNNQEDLDTAYDHSNALVVAGTTDSDTVHLNQKILTYYTQINGKREQDLTLDCTVTGPFTDYMQHKRQIRGSILKNVNVFQYNWFHCSDYCDFGADYDHHNTGELISGIPMTTAPLTWSFIGATMRPLLNNFQHYTWFVFVKKLTMSPGVVLVQ